MRDYTDYDVVRAPKSALPDSVYLRERLISAYGCLANWFRRYLPQISIIMLLLIGTVCFTYYYYSVR